MTKLIPQIGDMVAVIDAECGLPLFSVYRVIGHESGYTTLDLYPNFEEREWGWEGSKCDTCWNVDNKHIVTISRGGEPTIEQLNLANI
jgi:hypothetical protein